MGRATETKAKVRAEVEREIETEVEPGMESAVGAEEEGAEMVAQVQIALNRAQPTWRLYWVVNGERRPGIALGEGAVDERLTVPLGAPVFVRAEVWDSAYAAAGTAAEKGPTIESDAGQGRTEEGATGAGATGRGRCIALTNPIWYAPAAALAAVPAERRA